MIGLDIDGCMNCIKEDIIQIGKTFFGSDEVEFNPSGYYLKEIYSGADDYRYEEFWQKYGYTIYTNPPRDNVGEVIDFIRKNNIEACYVTTRDIRKSFNNIPFASITEDWLKKYDILLPVCYRKDKDKAAQELGINLFVEDKPANILKLQKVTDVLIYEHPYNADIPGKHVTDWNEIKEYILNNLHKLK